MFINRKSAVLCAAFSILATFATCSEDSPGKSTPTPTPTPEPEPEPEPIEVPEIAPIECDFNLDEAALTSEGWTKVFDENFETDLSKWNVWVGGAFNNELQHYQAANVELKEGALLIHAKREEVTGSVHPWDATPKDFDFTSGRIESKTNVSASASTPKVRMMARVKWPSGYGLWPAFWSYGDPWPTQGEIDMIEARGNEPTKYQTNYFYGTAANANLVQNAEGVITAEGDLTTCYHVYEMIWEKDKLTSILDGTVVEVKTSGGYIPQMFGKEQRITLNLAVGGLFFSNIDPALVEEGTLYVDWVKVFTSN